MMRQMFLATVMAMGLVAGVLSAAERATFVLADGSRHTGQIAFHGPESTNILDTFFYLGEDTGEKRYPVEEVAIIEFSGGQPTAWDFQQLSGGQGSLMVMRGPRAVRGRLVNIVNGDTIRWQNEAGQIQQYAVREVDRIYLNPRAARRLYPQIAGPSGGAGDRDSADTPLPAGAIRVSASQQWVETGIVVRKGQRVAFAATGQVHFSPAADHVSGPDGNPGVPSANLPVTAMSVGGLIGRVGNSQPFPIGSNRQSIVMPAAGPLLLGINDTITEDNTGSFVVVVSTTGR